MKRLAIVVVLLASAAIARADEKGAELYAKKCAMCHGKDGKGSPVGLKMGAKDLTTLKLDEDAVEKVVTDGKGKMTAFKGKMSPEEIEEVSEYVAKGLK